MEALAHQDLCCGRAYNNGKEVHVVERCFENVEVARADLPAVDEVEDLQKHEGVEDVGQVSSLAVEFQECLKVFRSVTTCGVVSSVGVAGSIGRSYERSISGVLWKTSYHAPETHEHNHDEEVPG